MTPRDPDKHHRLERQLRVACEEVDREIGAGRDYRVEDLLARCPEVAADEPSAVELIYTEFCAREDAGQQPALDDFYRRFPQWRRGLEEQFQVHRLLADEAGGGTSRGGIGGQAESGRRSIGAYDLLEEIAHGNMGVVYRARHRELGRLVALKTISRGPVAGRDALARFRTEASAVARLQHPNIVQIFEIGEADGLPYVVLEFIGGGSLSQRLSGRPCEPRDAARLVECLALATDYAHRQGVLHRDLKPANVLLTSEGTPKIVDFGIAKLSDRQDSPTEAGEVFGTPAYMAPEQARGHAATVGPAGDIYALGAILYELLTGRPPFVGESPLAILSQVLYEEPIAPERLHAGLPRDLSTICLKCLEKEPHRRYAGARKLAEDLGYFLAGEPIRARPSGVAERTWKWMKRRPSMAVLLAVTIAAAMALLLGVLLHNARLSDAVAEARQSQAEAKTAAEEADRQRAATASQAELARRQLDKARRSLYTIQLAQVEESWRISPQRALALLEDEERCPSHLRDFAWRLYYHLCTQDRILETGDSPVHSLAADSDTGLVAAGFANGAVQTWDVTTGEKRPGLPSLPGDISALAIARGGEFLIAANHDTMVRRLDIKSGGVRNAPWRGDGPATAAVISRDKRWLVLGGRDGNIRLWDPSTLAEKSRIKAHSGEVRTVVFSRDGNSLITAGLDRSVCRWSLPGLVEQDRFVWEGPDRVSEVAVSPDASSLAVSAIGPGDRGSSLSTWSLETRTRKATSVPLFESLGALAFSPDGKTVATGSEDRTVRLWDVNTCTERLVLKGHGNPVRKVAFFADGNTLVSAGVDRNIQIWSLKGRCFQDALPPHGSPIIAMAIAPRGPWLATGGADGTIKFYDIRSQRERATAPARHGKIWSLAFAPGGDRLAAGHEDGAVTLWSVPDGKELEVLQAHQLRVWCVAFSADGSLLATAAEDAKAKLWQVAGWRERTTYDGHGLAMLAAGFSHDGKRLATGRSDGKVEIWEVATGVRRAVLDGHTKGVLVAAFSPNGKWLVTGGIDSIVQVWDTDTFTKQHILSGHPNNVFSAAFTPDSATLIVGSGSRGVRLHGEVKLWDLATGQCHSTLADQTGPVGLADDGSVLGTVHDHTAVRLWHIDPVRPGPAELDVRRE
jgi:WD40 repeat protein